LICLFLFFLLPITCTFCTTSSLFNTECGVVTVS
jgi:hypothetical protein